MTVLTLAILVALLLLGATVALRIRRARQQEDEEPSEIPVAPRDTTEEQLQDLVEKGGNPRVLVEGSFHLRDALVVPEGLTVRGTLFLEEDSLLDAPVEVFGGTVLGPRARATRPLFVHGDLTLGKDACVPSCQVEGNVFFHPGSKVLGALRCHAVHLIEDPLEAAAASVEPPVVDLGIPG